MDPYDLRNCPQIMRSVADSRAGSVVIFSHYAFSKPPKKFLPTKAPIPMIRTCSRNTAVLNSPYIMRPVLSVESVRKNIIGLILHLQRVEIDEGPRIELH